MTKQIIDSRDKILISYGRFVPHIMISTHTKKVIFLAHKQHRITSRRYSRMSVQNKIYPNQLPYWEEYWKDHWENIKKLLTKGMGSRKEPFELEPLTYTK